MAFTFTTALNPATGSIAIYNLKVALIAGGWTVTSSSDATTYNASGDQITSGNSGTGGLGNTNAWFVLRTPTMADGLQRALCFQRGTTDLLWRIKYSQSVGFSGGTPGAARVPSATDEGVVCGTGTDAAPVGDGIFQTNGTYRQNIAIGDSANENYAFFSFGLNLGAATPYHFIMMDRLAAGTFPSADVDPFVLWAPLTTNFYNITNTTVGPRCWFAKGLGGQAFQLVAGIRNGDYNGGDALNALGSNHITGNDDFLPLPYARLASSGVPAGYKGFSKNLYVPGTTRSPGDTITVSATRDRYYFSNFTLPWDGSVAAI